jgi:hypothetical protein
MALTKVSRGLLSTSIVDNGNATAITIDSSENVGIGITSGLEKFTVANTSSGIVGRFTNNTNQTLDLGVISGSGAAGGVYYNSANSGYHAFQTGGTERMRIDSSGNLLVGATVASTLTKFQVSGTSSKFAGAFVNTATSAGYGLAISSGTGEAVYFYHGGTIGAPVGSIATSASSTSYNTSSDQRLKDNIADADDAGSKIDAIQVRKFDWKADGSHQDYGMIAQELQAVAPEAVSGDADSEDMMGVDYSKLVPMLIKEIQSLRNRVAQLEE